MNAFLNGARYLCGALTVYWAVMFVLYVCGVYTPDKIEIGAALVYAALGCLMVALRDDG